MWGPHFVHRGLANCIYLDLHSTHTHGPISQSRDCIGSIGSTILGILEVQIEPGFILAELALDADVLASEVSRRVSHAVQLPDVALRYGCFHKLGVLFGGCPYNK